MQIFTPNFQWKFNFLEKVQWNSKNFLNWKAITYSIGHCRVASCWQTLITIYIFQFLIGFHWWNELMKNLGWDLYLDFIFQLLSFQKSCHNQILFKWPEILHASLWDMHTSLPVSNVQAKHWEVCLFRNILKHLRTNNQRKKFSLINLLPMNFLPINLLFYRLLAPFAPTKRWIWVYKSLCCLTFM